MYHAGFHTGEDLESVDWRGSKEGILFKDVDLYSQGFGLEWSGFGGPIHSSPNSFRTSNFLLRFKAGLIWLSAPLHSTPAQNFLSAPQTAPFLYSTMAWKLHDNPLRRPAQPL
jgi:hypothetical protein